jgi:3-deoxy-D-manno-octulosonic-acid transferase
MSLLLDLGYLCALVLLSPWLIYKALTTGKYRHGLWRKFVGTSTTQNSQKRVVWFHGVSVGEIHLLRAVVAAFRRRHPDWHVVISSTTDTGLDEARKHFADCEVVVWPLDFSWSVRRTLRSMRPELVILAEGEMWPNFLAAAEAMAIPVAVINARMSPRSFRRYRLLGKLSRYLLRKITLFVAQTPEYAENLRRLGTSPERVHVSGSVKYDGVTAQRDNPRTRELCKLFGIDPGDLVLVAGSTQAPEEEIALSIYRNLHPQFPQLRLIVVPRQKDRFEEVAALMQGSGMPFVRRTQLGSDPPSIILVDTIGELSAVWGLADVAFVGGSLDGKRGGQNMLEPAAYGAAVVFGPHVWNFRDAASRLLACGGAMQIADALTLESTVQRLLSDPHEREKLGEAASEFVRSQQGATTRTLDFIEGVLLNDMPLVQAA